MFGEITASEAAQTIGIDTAKGTAKGVATGTGGVAVRYAARIMSLKLLAKADIATTIAASSIETGLAIRDYGKGKITERQLLAIGGGSEPKGTVASVVYCCQYRRDSGPPPSN